MKLMLFLTAMTLLSTSYAKDKKSTRTPQQVGGQIDRSVFLLNSTTGQVDAMKAITYLGYDDVCFTGSPEAAQKEIYTIIKNDGEKKSGFAKYVKKNDSIVYGFINTKCLDDSEGATDEGCRTIRIADRCK